MHPFVVRDSMRHGGRAEMEPEIIADVVRSRVGDRTFQHWFEDRTVFSIENDCLRVAVASPFLMTWMQKQLRTPLQEAATEILGNSGWFDLYVDASIATPRPEKSNEIIVVPEPDADAAPNHSGSAKVLQTGRLRHGRMQSVGVCRRKANRRQPRPEVQPVFRAWAVRCREDSLAGRHVLRHPSAVSGCSGAVPDLRSLHELLHAGDA